MWSGVCLPSVSCFGVLSQASGMKQGECDTTSPHVRTCSRGGALVTHAMAKQLHFNKNMEALKKLQAGVDKLSSVVGVTLGPKVWAYTRTALGGPS